MTPNLSKDSIRTIQKLLNSLICVVNPYGCQSKFKFEQYKLEVQYISKVFYIIYRKFLTAINHIDYHPTQIQNATRIKRSKEFDMHGSYHSYKRTLTPSEEIFLDKFLIALHKINPSLHRNLT